MPQGMRFSLMQEQALSQEMLLKLQGLDWHRIVVNAIADAVQASIQEVMRNRRDIALYSPIGEEFLLKRLTQEALYQDGQEVMTAVLSTASEETGASLIGAIQLEAHSIASQVVQRWVNCSHAYQSLSTSHGKRVYDAMIEDRRALKPEEQPFDHVPDLQSVAQARFSSATDETYETLRTATFRAGTPEDVHRIVASYRSAMLQSATLAYLEQQPGDRQEDVIDRIEQFRARMHKGVFIRNLDEESMCDDLNGRSLQETGMEFRIRLLEATDGRLLAWLSYLHNPLTGTPAMRRKRERYVRTYLAKGESKTGRVYYDDATPKDGFMKAIDTAELFLDIRSHFPNAAQRLGALSYREMLRDNHHLSYVYAYRLYDMRVEPPLSLGYQTRERGILPMVNDRSGDLFRSWQFRHIGYDRNKAKKGDHIAVRPDVAGQDRSLWITWDVMAGRLQEVERNATGLWKAHQRQRGDTSIDDPRSQR